MTDADSTNLKELKALSEASVTLTSELSLAAVLQKVVEVAKEQAGSTYAALSVLGPDGVIDQFLTTGISDEERAAIGPLPKGHGLLGVLLHKGQSLRLSHMSSDSRSSGFPPNHPPMTSLLGVPLVYAGRIIGNLYLTDKIGADSFTERDEEIVRLLAGQAAVAIRNAELYEAEQQRAEEWKALFDLGQQVTASPRIHGVLESVVKRARDLADADVATVMLLSPDGTQLTLAASDGLRARSQRTFDIETEAALQSLAIAARKPVIVDDTSQDERLKGRHAILPKTEGIVSMVVVPLAGKRGPLGTIMVADREPSGFTARQAELLEAFANWTAVAIESSRLYDQLESVARLEERERIGMDLHDGVMQTIYAVGLNLEDCLERFTESPEESRAGIHRAIDTLDGVIQDIRAYIFDLRPRVSVVADLPDALRQLVDDVRVNTLMKTTIDIAGDVDGLINENEALALFHIAQEALNNVIKHSRATSVTVQLKADRRTVSIDIRDNGVGIDPNRSEDYEHQGLRNMQDRSRSIGAELKLESEPAKGTRIGVELPVRAKEGNDG